MKLKINPGGRPSGLAQARMITGELPGTVEPRYRAEVAATEVAPFDWTILSAAAVRVEEPTVARGPRVSAWGFGVLLPFFALAFAALFFFTPPSENRLKGAVDLGFYVLRDGEVYPGDPSASFQPGKTFAMLRSF